MSNFVVSARKYRPIRFDSVVGQQHISQTLKNAIQSDHLAQAFLFCGPRGVGKTTCARILAKVLNCLNPTPDMEPCDTCESCASFNKNASLNIHELDAASNNSVEHIRALIDQVRFAPQSGKYKIYIIDEVHMLSQAAFNAFLKTLEEPPSYAIFILATTEKHKIIPTILSRCQIFDFNRIQIADMVAHLQRICGEETIQAEEDALTVIAQKADGALRDALSIFDRIVSFSGDNIVYQDVIENLNILDYDYYFKVVEAILSENVSQLLLLFDQITRKGFDGDIFTNGLAAHLRNLLVCKDPQTIELLEISGNIKERYQQQAAIAPLALILSALSIVNDCDINYKMARNKRLHVEMALIKMAYAQRASKPQIMTVAAPEKKNPELTTPNITQETAPAYQTTPDKKINPEPKAEPISDPAPATIPTTEPKDHSPSTTPSKKKRDFGDKLAQKSGNNLLSKFKKEVLAETLKPAEKGIDFTVANLQEIWDAHIETIESNSMKILYKTALLNLQEGEQPKVLITCSGSRAKDEILRDHTLKQGIMDKFQIKNLLFELTIDTSKVEKPKPKKLLPQTPQEKYVHFLGMNPLLKEFQKRFQLLPPKGSK
jgi:DNA polymerase-3 subunit gamma/tau